MFAILDSVLTTHGRSSRQNTTTICTFLLMEVVITMSIGILLLQGLQSLCMQKEIKKHQITYKDSSYLHQITPVSGLKFLQHIWQSKNWWMAKHFAILSQRKETNPVRPCGPGPMDSYHWVCQRYVSTCHIDKSPSPHQQRRLEK